LGQHCAALVEAVGFAKLMNADGGGDVGEVVFVAGRDDLVVQEPSAVNRFQASREMPWSDMMRMRSA
jgi:hypothetical protein